MERLTEHNTNTAAEYNRIFHDRKKAGIHWNDARRWKRLLKFYRGGTLLDIGTLDSFVPIYAKAKHPESEIVAVDIADEAVQAMAHQYPDIDYRVEDLYHLSFPDGHFSYVVLGEVLEHLEQPKDAIAEAARVTGKGYLAISTPLSEHRERGAVDGDHHLWSFAMQDIITMLKSYGRVSTALLGSRYFPSYKYAWPTIIAYCKR